jgi:hypothetical protein
MRCCSAPWRSESEGSSTVSNGAQVNFGTGTLVPLFRPLSPPARGDRAAEPAADHDRLEGWAH